MVTVVVTVFVQGLSRSTAAAIELLGNAFGGIVVSDRASSYNHLPTQQRQLLGAPDPVTVQGAGWLITNFAAAELLTAA